MLIAKDFFVSDDKKETDTDVGRLSFIGSRLFTGVSVEVEDPLITSTDFIINILAALEYCGSNDERVVCEVSGELGVFPVSSEEEEVVGVLGGGIVCAFLVPFER